LELKNSFNQVTATAFDSNGKDIDNILDNSMSQNVGGVTQNQGLSQNSTNASVDNGDPMILAMSIEKLSSKRKFLMAAAVKTMMVPSVTLTCILGLSLIGSRLENTSNIT
jgi:hypothetical protein